MGITGAYYMEKNNLEEILAGRVQRPRLDIDKTWSLIAGMFPDVPLVPVQEQYRVDSEVTEYGAFYLPAEMVAQIAVQVPGLRQPERLEERIDFEKWTSLQDMDVEALDEQSLILLAFPMTDDETYEELVEEYLLPHLQSLFDLFEEAARQQYGLVFFIF
ncbi:hypothetical protein AMQ84_31270 [Paenibacillus riograndensis]|uniref:DUF1877 domain-containing protein n=1 Tax=Paenibacillus riograndensis TaxID=483937 RepID=A0A132TDQ5_9BACL|nr:hypothetical protein [Paenibacillus riograndensis]KWX69464.1 hypothetical protein AMQ84_31270 [Paenibacillus riograndensis]